MKNPTWDDIINYKFDEDSLVFDVGGYDGKWAEIIFNKYRCNIYIFEPVAYYYNIIKNKFKDNDKIKIFNIGLSNENKEEKIYISGDSSSIHKKVSNKTENIQLVAIDTFIIDNDIKNVNLMKLNIEGEEYNLIEKLIYTNKVSVFNNLLIQFHKISDDSEKRRNNIREEFIKTHTLTYDCDFVFENWKKK
jgi:FkbM family methyltransferase